MFAYILLMIRTCIVSSQTVLEKSFQLGFRETTSNFLKYNLINGVFASFFLFVLNGFHLNCNFTTLMYSLFFAVAVGLCIVLVILALGRTSIPLVYIISTSGSVILSTLFGIFALGDEPTINSIIAVILLMTAVLISYSKNQNKGGKSALLIYLLLFLDNGAVIIIIKLYSLELEAASSRVCDEKSFYILSNLIIVAACIIIAAFLLLKKKTSFTELIKPFGAKQTLNICARTALNNLDSLVMIWAVTLMDLSIFSVTTSAMIIVANTILSVFLFKEKLSKKQYAAALIAISAIIIGA